MHFFFNAKNNRMLNLFSLLRSAFIRYKWHIVIMAALNFFSSLLEGIGINAVIPIFALIYGNQITGADVVSKTINKLFLYLNLSYTIKTLLVFIILLFIIRAIVLFFSYYITVKITTDYEKNTRAKLFELMLGANWSYLSKQKIGHLDQILLTDVTRSSGFLLHMGLAMLVLTNLFIYGFIVVNISLTVAILIFILGGMIFLIFKPLFFKNRQLSAEVAQKFKEIAHYVGETTIGIKTIKSMFVEKPVLQAGLNFFDRLKYLNIKVSSLQNFTNVTLQPMGLFVIVGIFAFFYKTAAFNFASFAVMVYAINKVFGNLQLAQGEVHDLSARLPHLRSVLSYLDDAAKHKEQVAGTKKFDFKDKLKFQQVGFSYVAEKEILSDVSFSVKQGEMLGLAGPSGAGKTTIVDLLLRLFEPKQGKILLDGVDISTIALWEWRTKIGYVSQDMFLINDTILNNIKFYDDSINYDDAIESAKAAGIYEFISHQPNQFETIVGERGLRLSGGERQRIILSRILARKPRVLILDEATSALDNESEALIQRSIEMLRGKITVIAIAHRLSTITNFDRLIILEDGKIIEEGSPQELFKDEKSYFWKMYHLKK